MDTFQQKAQELLDLAGITINGTEKHDIQVHDDRLFQRVIAQGSRGLGEAYVEGWWDCEALDEFFYRILNVGLDRRIRPLREAVTWLKASVMNLQKPSRAFTIGEHHYDIGDDLYEMMLDKRMVYSCGYWNNADSLDKAQERKLDLIFQKLGLQEGMRVLDIGCGWGGALQYAAEKYGVNGIGVTVSRNQAEKAKEMCRDYPVDIHLQDYRELYGSFDRIWSIGMIEHVGVKNYRTFMRVARRCLKPDGLFLLQTIGGNRSVFKSDTWINKYIFPNSMVPSIRQIGLSLEDLFVMEDWHNFGIHYTKTLLHWHENIMKHREQIIGNYGPRFLRMWRYYLLSCSGTFRARKNQLWQIVLSPQGVSGGYESVLLTRL